jgi:hypothetical protein
MVPRVTWNQASRSLLTPRDLSRFEGDGLFEQVGRAVCGAGCLPRKELYESWEVAQRARAAFRGGAVFDLACGHGLLAHLLLLLDGSSPRAQGLDARLPESAPKLAAALAEAFPALAGKVELAQAPLSQARPAAGDLVVSAHACGPLTDEVLALAAAAQARVAVLPCCHDGDACDAAGLEGWLDAPLAIDAVRAVTLRDRGYSVTTLTIPASITPKNRLLLGRPLLEVYVETAYDVHLPGGTVSLRHGARAPALDALLAPEATEWAFLTAWNPGSRLLARPENERRQAVLVRSLSGRYRLFHGEGRGDDGAWPPELSVLALGLPLAEALRVGRAWGQVAVLAGRRGEPARVRLCAEE